MPGGKKEPDFGNLGTIIRTCVGFGIRDLAIVEPAADIFHPRTIRASMGALFQMNIRHYPDFQPYYQEYGQNRMLYPFMLKGTKKLGTFEIDNRIPYSLIFGNESSGLANGIAIYEFTKSSYI